MILGIVGPEARAWTAITERRARNVIRAWLQTKRFAGVTSGECPRGGVDIFAREEAEDAGLPFRPFPPRDHCWASGYKPRNIQIATLADIVLCVTLESLYTCKHCRERHIGSGGCWTQKYARSLGKGGFVVAVRAQ